jgi:hypothetical protein
MNIGTESKDTSHMHVYALADMLDVPDLKLAAMKKLQSQLEKNWVAESFSEIVKEVYSTTNTRDKEIRDLVISSALAHLVELCQVEGFKEVLNEFGEFSGVLVMSGNKVPISGVVGCKCSQTNWQIACMRCSKWNTV